MLDAATAGEISWREAMRPGGLRPGKRALLMSFVAIVLLPTLVAAVFLTLIASNRYTSEFRAAVRNIESMHTGSITAMLGLATTGQSSVESYAVTQYLQSWEGFAELDQKAGLVDAYRGAGIDWFSRLPAGASGEAIVRYWRGMMAAVYEPSTSTIIVRVTAFSPTDATRISRQALVNAEALVNRMSARARADTLGVAAAAVKEAEQRLQTANEALRTWRDKEGILDPRKAAETNLVLANRVREEITKLRADLILQRATALSESSLAVSGARERIAALEQELAHINSELTSMPTSTGTPLSVIIGRFDQLESDRQFAEKAYQSALTSFEAARADAARQQVYLATIVQPDRPQEASFPRPVSGTLSVLAVAALTWGLVVLLALAVREHV